MMNVHVKNRDSAVSPVVGVMLMLVVTIIIAAVVSAYAGGLSSSQKKAPNLDATVKISNDGYWAGQTYFICSVNAVSEPIPTKDLKMTISWKAAMDGTTYTHSITGPNTSVGATGNTYYGGRNYQSPLGYGPGVNASVTISSYGPGGNYWPDQQWGNYTLIAGTTFRGQPTNYGNTQATRYQYSDSAGYYTYADNRDMMQAVLGREWWKLRTGDVVKVKIQHVPSGKLIFDKDVIVEGST